MLLLARSAAITNISVSIKSLIYNASSHGSSFQYCLALRVFFKPLKSFFSFFFLSNPMEKKTVERLG